MLMGSLELFIFSGIILTGLMVGLYFLGLKRNHTIPIDYEAAQDPVFLFEGSELLDATPAALTMIATHCDNINSLDMTIQCLTAHFPQLRHALETKSTGTVSVNDRTSSGLYIEIKRTKNQTRLAIRGRQTLPSTPLLEHDVQTSELLMMREIIKHSPQLIWQQNSAGKLIWANQAYLIFYDTISNGENQHSVWPETAIFPDLHETQAHTSSRRLSIVLPDKKSEQWFDVTTVKSGDTYFSFANDANAVVRADQDRRNLVQTLGKTFAELSIGLAIFDHRRQLAMFNPALIDMTNLPPEFLSGRPTVDTVLDRLRESRMLPEPKNYTSWRDRFTALEAAAKDGSYAETWNLPDGQTYRVTGRPHPNGAFAFLFEDISAEVSLTRSFRSDIQTAQAVMDALPQAVAVFSSAGTLVESNKAYSDLWGQFDTHSAQQPELSEVIGIWQSRCIPTKIWESLQSFVHALGPRDLWEGTTVLDDGRQVTCHAQPISGGMTMVEFKIVTPARPVIQKLISTDPALMVNRR